jgi:phosphoglycerate dehydrogenase-like enzyme
LKATRLQVVAYTRGDTPLDDVSARFPEIDFHHCVQSEDAARVLPAAEVLFIARRMTAEDGRFISKRLRWLHASGAGVDHVLPFLPPDIDPIITNTRGLSAGLIADYVICATLVLRWQMLRALRAQADHRWERWATLPLVGRTMVLLGVGTVGKEVSSRAKGMGMRVVGIRRRAGAIQEVDECYPVSELHHVLRQADVLVVTLPLTPATANLIDDPALEAMKLNAIVIVVGRGRVVNEDALASALRKGRLAGAALDVFAAEPLDPASRLWDTPNLLLTSHIAGELPDIRERNAAFFKDNLRRFLRGDALQSVIDREAGY